MLGPKWKSLLIGGVVVATLAIGAAQADACWRCGWHYPVSWGYTAYYTPSYSSCCTVGCDSCCSTGCGWYAGYRPGPVRRLLFGPYRWYYGCGSVCASTYTSCCVDSCCGTGVGTMTPTVESQGVPTEAQKPVMSDEASEPSMPQPATDTAPSTQHTRANSGLLTIYVPHDAKIKVNGLGTQSQGSRRRYVSYGLKPGFTYKYEIYAEVVHDGQLVEDVRTVSLTAGDRKMVTFGFNLPPGEGLASR